MFHSLNIPKRKFALTLITCAAMLSACSTGVKKADIAASADPKEEIAKLDSSINSGLAAQYDVLSPEEFQKSQSYLKKAKQEAASDHSREKILENVAYGQTFFEKARSNSESRGSQIEGVVKARQAALDAGAKSFPGTVDRLKNIDDDLRSYSDDLRGTSADKIAKLQGRYLDVQLAAVIDTQTSRARAQIDATLKDGAAKNTPKALKQAEVDLKTAQNQIAANRDNPASFKAAVDKANASAQFLVEVLAATKKSNPPVNEATAATVVLQSRQISNLKGEVGNANAQAEATSETLAAQNEKLSSATAKVGVQQAMETARKEFTPEEAEVFQQGDKLLIRLKTMNFSSGRSDLPAESLAILAKVKSVAEGLGPQSVVVEGHTDSVGTAKVNESLSTARAQAVATYLATNGIAQDKVQAVGYGFKKPLATNKSKSGRAQNRRVDVIITPQTF